MTEALWRLSGVAQVKSLEKYLVYSKHSTELCFMHSKWYSLKWNIVNEINYPWVVKLSNSITQLKRLLSKILFATLKPANGLLKPSPGDSVQSVQSETQKPCRESSSVVHYIGEPQAHISEFFSVSSAKIILFSNIWHSVKSYFAYMLFMYYTSPYTCESYTHSWLPRIT